MPSFTDVLAGSLSHTASSSTALHSQAAADDVLDPLEPLLRTFSYPSRHVIPPATFHDNSTERESVSLTNYYSRLYVGSDLSAHAAPQYAYVALRLISTAALVMLMVCLA